MGRLRCDALGDFRYSWSPLTDERGQAVKRPDIDFQTLFQAMPTPFMMLDQQLCFVAANAAYLAVTGRRASDLIGKYVFDAFPDTPDRQAKMERAFARALTGTENTVDRNVFAIDRPGKGRVDVYWDIHHTPVRNAAGVIVGVLQYAQDVSAEVEAERMRDVMSQEYDHRVRNLMARISAIARQTGRQTNDTPTFLAEFERRIAAMARTHELLVHGGWETLGLRALVDSALEPHAGEDPADIHIDGDDLTLSSRVGQALGMALHELATNAAKYGALSLAGGRLTITWAVQPDRTLQIEWRETGLTDVATSGPNGFGSTLIDRVLPLETGGKVDRRLTATGLACTIVLPDPQLA
jgi:PAS domain S-box-containing protein